MTALSAIHDRISIDDYLLGEETSEIKHEYLDGQVYAMTGTTMPGASLECEAFLEEWNPGMDYTATRKHNLLTMSLSTLLHAHARKRGCQLFASDMKLRLDHRKETYFYYPDLLLTCADDDRHPLYFTQPCLLIEVLSTSTKRIDCREKLLAYSLIPSLREYLIVDQERIHINLYRSTDQDWTHTSHSQGHIHLDCLDCDIALTDIYADLPELTQA